MDHLRAALKGDPSVPLDRAALDMAAIEYPGLDAEPSLRRLDEIAATLERRAGSENGAGFVAAANQLLFEELGFRGNQTEYYDPRNSCLNEVLERKTGIPITLSVVYMEVARRLRRPVSGIGLPGHFLVEYNDGHYRTYVDPFHEGKLLTADDCAEVARGTAGADIANDPAALRAATNPQILARMLNNLQSAYTRAGSHAKAVEALDLLIEAGAALAGNTWPLNYRSRAVAHLHLRHFVAARLDLETYLRLAPEAEDRDAITRQLEAIHRWLGSVN